MDFRKNQNWFFSGWISQKSLPITPPDFWKWCRVLIDLSEYGFKYGENWSPPKKMVVKNQQWKKNNLFEQNFSPLKLNFFELFFLVSYSKLCEVSEAEKKSKTLFLHGKNDGEILIGYTFHVSYTYRADCTYFAGLWSYEHPSYMYIRERSNTVVLVPHIKYFKKFFWRCKLVITYGLFRWFWLPNWSFSCRLRP